VQASLRGPSGEPTQPIPRIYRRMERLSGIDGPDFQIGLRKCSLQLFDACLPPSRFPMDSRKSSRSTGASGL
jgi:hypothetical protein